MDLSYVGLMELIQGLDDDVVQALPAPQARLLRVILRKEDPEASFDRLSLNVAMVAAVRAVASAKPMLVAVDDAQWLDHPTAKTLAFVVRRLAGTSARIAVASRSNETVDLLVELARAMPEARFDTIRLGPIGPSELSRILRRAIGWAPAWPRVVRIAELSDGNPLYALELTRAFGRVQSSEDLERSLPDSVLELARSRIAKLPGRVREALELASVPRAPTLDLLRRLDSRALDLRDALATAERSGIVTLDGERDPVLASDPRRRRVRVDPDRPEARAAPRRRDALRRSGGAGPSSCHSGRGTGPGRGGRVGGRRRGGVAPRRARRGGRPAPPGVPAHAAD